MAAKRTQHGAPNNVVCCRRYVALACCDRLGLTEASFAITKHNKLETRMGEFVFNLIFD